MHFIGPVWFYNNPLTFASWFGLGVAGGVLPCQYQPLEAGKSCLLSSVALSRRLPQRVALLSHFPVAPSLRKLETNPL